MSTIFKVNGTDFNMEELSAFSCKLTRKNSAADEITMETDVASPAAQWSYDDSVELWQNGVRRFAGRIVKNTKRRAGKKDVHSVLIKNPFYELERVIYQQSTAYYNGGIISMRNRSRVTLGGDGNAGSIQKQIKNIIKYASEHGVNVAEGTIDISGDMLVDEATDITCAEAIVKTMRWCPCSCAYFDYSSEGAPLLNVRPRSALENTSVCAEDGNVKSFSANRRDDLRVDSVLINYERENAVDGNVYLEVLEDKYPADAEAGGKNSIVMCVELGGSKSVSQTHSIKTQSVNVSSAAWWKKHVNFLNRIGSFTIVSASRSGGFNNELTDGSIPKGLGYSAKQSTATGTFEYTNPATGGREQKTISVRLKTTTALTGDYRIWKQTEVAETKPEGLAKSIYEAASVVQYEGELELFDAKAEDYFGKTVSVKNAQQTVLDSIPPYFAEENLAKRTLRLKFGPVKHLYPDDIVELFRINRSRKPVTLRVSAGGKVSGSSNVFTGGESPSTYLELEDSVKSRLILKTSNGSKKVDINADALGAGETAEFYETYVCYNGMLAKTKVLMTTPVIQQ